MEPIKNQLSSAQNQSRATYEEIVQSVMTDPRVIQFIAEHQMTQQEIERSIPKFLEFISEEAKFAAHSQDVIATGYQPILIMNEGYADVSYLETQELIDFRREEAVKNRIRLISLPASLRAITQKDLDFQDENRFEVYQALQEVISSAPDIQRGLYLFGHFGIGKSYLMAYLAHQLSKQHQLATTMLHYPTFAVDIRNAIKDASVKEKIDDIKSAQVLILDDIGAEQHSAWVRDDVLQVILQHRMQENLPTFFTSNFSFKDLERHFAAGRNGDETWQAKRVMERIRYLAKEIHLEGVNRRYE
ncbi:primosomal protein DnaI [Streptococcus sp. DD13]|uniref:primosomal protein DnaI n=1 Tax=Streptococcus sp. DD13 TaxID=1777881 RepID=UPI0007924A4A|nr:primosomal protein DnaI [Streptococcus sp. DD13]KXT78205.1 Helicase loader DnaI [Streptococcus sp. DD13]